MKQDEIIEMAIQAGAIPVHKDSRNKALVGNKNIEAFAKLVADVATAKERYACMNICLNFADVDSGPDGIEQDYHAKLIAARGKA